MPVTIVHTYLKKQIHFAVVPVNGIWVQGSYYCYLVGYGVMRRKVKVVVCVGLLSVHSSINGAIWVCEIKTSRKASCPSDLASPIICKRISQSYT